MNLQVKIMLGVNRKGYTWVNLVLGEHQGRGLLSCCEVKSRAWRWGEKSGEDQALTADGGGQVCPEVGSGRQGVQSLAEIRKSG